MPGAVPSATVSVKVDVVPVGAAGTNAAVTPEGNPPTASVTAPVKFVRVIVTVEVPFAPSWIVSAAADSDSA